MLSLVISQYRYIRFSVVQNSLYGSSNPRKLFIPSLSWEKPGIISAHAGSFETGSRVMLGKSKLPGPVVKVEEEVGPARTGSRGIEPGHRVVRGLVSPIYGNMVSAVGSCVNPGLLKPGDICDHVGSGVLRLESCDISDRNEDRR